MYSCRTRNAAGLQLITPTHVETGEQRLPVQSPYHQRNHPIIDLGSSDINRKLNRLPSLLGANRWEVKNIPGGDLPESETKNR